MSFVHSPCGSCGSLPTSVFDHPEHSERVRPGVYRHFVVCIPCLDRIWESGYIDASTWPHQWRPGRAPLHQRSYDAWKQRGRVTLVFDGFGNVIGRKPTVFRDAPSSARRTGSKLSRHPPAR